MILYIDTSDYNRVTFALSHQNKLKKKTYKLAPHENFETLSKLDEFLKYSRVADSASSIKKIVVNKGPGSFMGVRVGVSIAMALGFAWRVPVKAVPKDKFKIGH